ncbi:Metaxin-3 [Terramyces sp. JEL0728]|nr:Metaxin-3 [Terramyces sp. JEL0728]
MANLELYAWGQGFNQSSFDPFCLSIEAYLNLVQVKWVVNECCSTDISPSGELPLLKVGFEPITGTFNIIKVLKARGHDLDHLLTPIELAESQAFISLIEDKLHDCLLYTWFLEQENYQKTKSIISTNFNIYNKYLFSKQKNRVKTRLQNRKDFYDTAREIYKTLADKLGSQSFFYGSTSTLDVVAFAHLSLHCYPSLKIPQLFSILTFEFPTLIAFVERMSTIVYATPLVRAPSPKTNIKQLLMSFIENPTGEYKETTKEERIKVFYRNLTTFGAVDFD